MTFVVTYRAGDGSRKTEVVEAASRGEAFAAMRSRGINPLSARQGTRADSTQDSRGGRSRPTWKTLAVAAGMAFALFGLWRLLPRHEDVAQVKPVSSKAEKSPAKPVVKPVAPIAASPSIKPIRKHADAAPVRVAAPTVEVAVADVREDSTNTPRVLTPEERLAEAKSKMKFKTAEEQLLSMVTPDEPGGEVPPVPIADEEEDTVATAKGVANVLKPEKGDDENTLQRKMDISEMKLEYAELKKQGWTFARYVKALAAKRNEEAADLHDARRVMEELYKDSTVSDEEYAAAKKQINDSLKEKGLPAVEPESEKAGDVENAGVGQENAAEPRDSETQNTVDGKEKEKDK